MIWVVMQDASIVLLSKSARFCESRRRGIELTVLTYLLLIHRISSLNGFTLWILKRSLLVSRWILINSFAWTVVIVHGSFQSWTLFCKGYLLLSIVFYLQPCNHRQCIKRSCADCLNQSVIACALQSSCPVICSPNGTAFAARCMSVTCRLEKMFKWP